MKLQTLACSPRRGPLLRWCMLVVTLWASFAYADDYSPVNNLLRTGQLQAAMAKADEYLAKNPRDPQMRFLRGLIQQDAGRLDDAMTTYAGLITDYPELPEPYNNIAVLYANKGEFDKARDALLMAIRNKQSYAVAYENLGDVYMRLAGQSYQHAQQLDNRNITVAPKLSMIRQMLPPAPTRPASK